MLSKKRSLVLVPLLGVAGGCGAFVTAPVSGFLYTNVTAPVTATSQSSVTKSGSATCTSYLGLVATGDCSIEAAAARGGISTIHHVDHKSNSLFGLFAKYTIYVYGT